MKITIVAVGKIKDKWLKQGIAEYQKRISKYADINIIEVKDLPDNIDRKTALARETANIMARLADNDYKILLDLGGKSFDSLEIAENLPKWFVAGGSKICFIIGGSNGFDDSIRAKVNLRWQLSSLTFTHQQTRLLLLEQIYRAFKINNNETYHK